MIMRLAIAIFASNVLTMAIMNAFELSSLLLTGLYGACFALILATTRKVTFPTLERGWLMASLVLGLVLFLPRLPYLMETVYNVSINAVCFDDWWHFQELSSLVNTANYPAISTFNKDYFLGFYYAPWMLGAALSVAKGLTTLRQSMGVMILIYVIIVASFVSTAATVLFHKKLERVVFVILALFYGGFDFSFWFLRSLANGRLSTENAEWWAQIFGFNLQYSNFFTLNLWVIHHTIAAVIFLSACWLLAFYSSNRPLVALAGVLLASSLFSSVFVFIGGLPLLFAWLIQRNIRLQSAVLALGVTTITSLPLLWIYLSKTSSASKDGFRLFTTSPWPAPIGLALFLVVILLELGPVLVPAAIAARASGRMPLYSAAMLYVLSTFFISFTGYNNYAMRGTILPIFTLIALATGPISGWLRLALTPASTTNRNRAFALVFLAVLLPYLGGGLLEYSLFSLKASAEVQNSMTSNINKMAFQYNLRRKSFAGEIRTPSADSNFDWYLFDQHSSPKAKLAHSDSEIMIPDSSWRLSLPKLLDWSRPDSGR